MKKLLFSVLAATMFAVGAQAQVGYGLKAGVNLGKISNSPLGGLFDVEGVNIKEANNTSFYITGFADIPVAPNFAVQPGLSLQGKGSKSTLSFEDESAEISANIMSIEIPVNAVYYIPAGSGSVFLGAGPYAGYNISGKISGKLNGEDIDFEGEDEIEFSGDDKDMNAFDAGINFLGGYKLSNGLIINAGYGLGLTNLNPDSDSDKWTNKVLSFGIGFQF